MPKIAPPDPELRLLSESFWDDPLSDLFVSSGELQASFENVDSSAGSRLSSFVATPFGMETAVRRVAPPEMEFPSHSSTCSLDEPLSPLLDPYASFGVPGHVVLSLRSYSRQSFERAFHLDERITDFILQSNIADATVLGVPSRMRLCLFILGKRKQLRKYCQRQGIFDVHRNLATCNMNVHLSCAEADGDNLRDEEIVRRFIDMITEFWGKFFEGASTSFDDDDDEGDSRHNNSGNFHDVDGWNSDIMSCNGDGTDSEFESIPGSQKTQRQGQDEMSKSLYVSAKEEIDDGTIL
jgi:hypothetical protein